MLTVIVLLSYFSRYWVRVWAYMYRQSHDNQCNIFQIDRLPNSLMQRSSAINIVWLQSNSQNCEHLKYLWNVNCVITNHVWDLQPQKQTSFHWSWNKFVSFQRSQNNVKLTQKNLVAPFQNPKANPKEPLTLFPKLKLTPRNLLLFSQAHFSFLFIPFCTYGYF